MYELEPFNIHVTLVEPGPSRRDEPDENINGPSPMWGHFLMKPPTDAYRATTSPAQHATRMVDWLRFRQPTSAVRIAKMVWELGHCRLPPLRLLLGSHAVDSIRDRLRSTIEEVSAPCEQGDGANEGRLRIGDSLMLLRWEWGRGRQQRRRWKGGRSGDGVVVRIPEFLLTFACV